MRVESIVELQAAAELDKRAQARRARLTAYEHQEARVANFTRAVARLELQIATYQAQLTIFDQIATLTEAIDPEINVYGKVGLLRPALISMLALGRTDQQRRLDEVTTTLVRARDELKKAQGALSEV